MKQIVFIVIASALVLGFTATATSQQFDLPDPFATESSRNSASIIDRPASAEIQLPDGFEAEIYASDFQGPRTMVAAPNGALFVAQSRAGSVIVLQDTNSDGQPDSRTTFAEGLRGVFGIAFHDDYVYFGVTDRLIRYPYQSGDTAARGTEEKLADLKSGGHSTRDIVFNRSGTNLYVAVGSMSNKSDGEPETRAAINEFNPDGTGHRVFASGNTESGRAHAAAGHGYDLDRGQRAGHLG
jgi:glucose/arabinose dehydrogenase